MLAVPVHRICALPTRIAFIVEFMFSVINKKSTFPRKSIESDAIKTKQHEAE